MKLSFYVSLIFIWAGGALIGASLGISYMRNEMQKAAIENNVAHYDTKTRDFVWDTQSE